jgi:tetratricopeptide (TPR) repeat protein
MMSSGRWLAVGGAVLGVGALLAVSWLIYAIQSKTSFWAWPGITGLAIAAVGFVALVVGFVVPADEDGAIATPALERSVSTGKRGQTVIGNTGIVISGDVTGSTVRLSTYHAGEGSHEGVSPPEPKGGLVVVGDVPQQPPAYQSRDVLLRRLPGSGSGPGICVVHAVTGMPGIGKTQLAADYARRRIRDKWRLVAWVNAESTVTTLDGLTEAALALGIPLSDHQPATARSVRHWLEADGERCLIVFDNASDPDNIRPYLPSAGDAQVIVTSTNQAVTGLGISIPLDVFTEKEALTYLTERTGVDDAAGARELVTELDRLPLALAQATAVIRSQRLSYPAYLERLRAFPVEQYLARSSEDPYPRATAATILLSLRAAEDSDPTGLSTHLMSVIAVLSSAGALRDVLYTAAAVGLVTRRKSPRWPRLKRRSGGGPSTVRSADVDAALGHMAAASLLTFSFNGSTVSAHRLTMRVTRERCLRDGTLLFIGVEAASALFEATQSLGSVWEHPAAARDLTQQITSLHDHMTPVIGTSDDPGLAKVLVSIRAWALWCLLELGDSAARAVKLGEALTADAERLLGPSDWVTLVVRGNLAVAYEQAGRLADARLLHERNLADRERALGPDDPITVAARDSLAYIYSETGQTDKAIPRYERALADRERALGPDHPETLVLRHNLAATYQDASQVDKAIPLLERNLADRERVLGQTNRDTLQSRNNLALAYQQVGRIAEAIPLHEQALADRERLLGPDHPDTIESRENLATAYQHSAHLEKAVPMLERTLADRQRVLGLEHPLTLTSQANLAAAYLQAGQTDKALPLAEHTLPARERVLGSDHPDTLTSLGCLAMAYVQATKPDKAIPLAERTIHDAERILGLDHPDTLAARGTLAIAYLMRGRTRDAIPALKRTIADYTRVFGPDHSETRAFQLVLQNVANPRGKRR